MQPFRLTDAAFAALAAGRPTPDTLAVLHRAQFSRNLLLLAEIMRTRTPQWYAGQPSPEVLTDPMTGLYAATAVAALRTGTTPPERPSLVVPSGRTLSSSCDGQTLRVRLEDSDPLRDRLGLSPTDRLGDAAAARWQEHLHDAWCILVRRHPAAAVTVAAVLRVIVPVRPDRSAGGISATSANAFGAVAMSSPTDGRSLAVGLVHEIQHSLLNAARWLFDLVRPSSERGYSPWRDDPRPPFGILHGAYAYLAVTRFWRTEAAVSAESPEHAPDGRLAAFEFARWRAAVPAAADDLLAGDSLTAAGRRFATALRDEAAGWLTDPVDPEVLRLAEGANTDHRVRWRLRNLRLDPTATQPLVRAWREDRAPPAIPEPVLRRCARRQLEANPRLDLVHKHLRQPTHRDAPGGAVRSGDDAYLRGDYETAYLAYRRELAETTAARLPAREADDVWSGLALVSGLAALRERPELVRAVHLALGDADLPALAAWLGQRSTPGDPR